MLRLPASDFDIYPPERLIILAQSKGPDADKARVSLLKAHTPLLLSSIRCMPQDSHEDAFAAACTAFLEALTRFDRCRGFSIGVFASKYILGAISRLHINGSYNVAALSLVEDFGCEDPKLDEFEEADQRARDIARVQTWMGSLPRKHQNLLRLKFWNGLSHVEIAKRLGVSEPAISTALKRLYTRARRELSKADC